MEGRSAIPEIQYNGKNITTALKDYLTGFDYTDAASGESDSIQIKLMDRDMKWMGDWFPAKEDKIAAQIQLKNWHTDIGQQSFNCGNFIVDDLKFSGSPFTCNIGAVSIPANADFKVTKKTKTWKSVTVQAIASEIAAGAGIALFYDAESVTIECTEQSKETDSEFLYKVCKDYGLAMKVYAEKIIIFDMEKYEEKPPVLTLDLKDLISWDYTDSLAGTYTGAKISYTNGKKNTDISVEVGKPGRILEVNEKADNIQDAERKAKAKLYEENKKAVTASVAIMGTDKIVASSTIQLTGLSKLSGKFFVDKVKHSVGKGYKVSLELHKVPEKEAAPVEQQTEAAPQGIPYTIKSGDTLWMLAKQFLGSGARNTEIYSANADIIEAEAKRRGKASSNNGHWIYPGTTITIPQ